MKSAWITDIHLDHEMSYAQKKTGGIVSKDKKKNRLQVKSPTLIVLTSNSAASQEIPWGKGAFLKVLLGRSLKAVVSTKSGSIFQMTSCHQTIA